jgi:hypothetical protein
MQLIYSTEVSLFFKIIPEDTYICPISARA